MQCMVWGMRLRHRRTRGPAAHQAARLSPFSGLGGQAGFLCHEIWPRTHCSLPIMPPTALDERLRESSTRRAAAAAKRRCAHAKLELCMHAAVAAVSRA